MPRIAYYEANIQEFLIADEDAILGALSMQHGFALEHLQKHAWQGQIRILRSLLAPTRLGWIFFEFSIPRMGKRADVVLLAGGVVFVIEFKVGSHALIATRLSRRMTTRLISRTFTEAVTISQSSRY